VEKKPMHVYFGKKVGDLPITLGLALRAAGAGFNVGYFVCAACHSLPYANAKNPPDLRVDFVVYNKNLDTITEKIEQYDMTVLQTCNHLSKNDLAFFIKNRPAHTELILCGQAFDDEILTAADLISEIRGGF